MGVIDESSFSFPSGLCVKGKPAAIMAKQVKHAEATNSRYKFTNKLWKSQVRNEGKKTGDSDSLLHRMCFAK